MFLISVYVPSDYLTVVKEAMFAQGAGRIGAYSHCAWQVLGEGQFMPLADSDAFIGEKNQLETVPEYKIDMVCAEECIAAVVAAMKAAHPYETPAYHVLAMASYEGC